jgi:pimeloyl-ACP methyl ester carboxylesterase
MPRIRAAGHSLEYEQIDGATPALVFLHEGLGSIRQWRGFPARAAQATGRKAFVYDRYGYGASDVLKEAKIGVRFMHREGLEALPELLQAAGIENPILVGHSDGASISLIHAGAGNPVRALVLLAPHVFVEESNLASIRKIRTVFETTDLRERLGKYHADPGRTFCLWNDAWLDPEFARWNIEEYLPAIRCPVLAIQGIDDEYGTMAQLRSIREKTQGPCEVLELAACGHSPHRDQPDTVLAALTRFVAGLS